MINQFLGLLKAIENIPLVLLCNKRRFMSAVFEALITVNTSFFFLGCRLTGVDLAGFFFSLQNKIRKT